MAHHSNNDGSPSKNPDGHGLARDSMAASGTTWTDLLRDFANVFKAFIGVNYLSMAFAMSQAGLVLGSIGLAVIAIVTSHCCSLIVKCKHTIIANICSTQGADEDTISRQFQYGDVAVAVWGERGRYLVDFFLFLTQFGFCVGYFIFLGNTLHDLAPAVSTDVAIASLFGVAVLCAFIRDLRHLGYASVAANISLLFGFVVVLSRESKDFSIQSDVEYFRWSTVPIFFGIATSSYEGIGTIIPIESSMRENRSMFPRLLRVALICITAILGSFGVLGYLAYGSNVDQIIITELPDDDLSRVVRASLLVGVMFTYPMQLFPVTEIVESFVTRLRNRRSYSVTDEPSVPLLSSGVKQPPRVRLSTMTQNLIRFLLVAATAGLAIAFKAHFGYFSSIIGSVGSSMLAFILPAIFDVMLHRRSMTRLLLAKNAIIVCFGALGAAAGLYSSILAMV